MSTVDKCFAAIRKNFSTEEFSDAEIRSMIEDFVKIQEASGISEFMAKANDFRKILEQRAIADARRKAVTLSRVKDLKSKTVSELDATNAPKQVYERAQNVFTGGGQISDGGNFSAQYIKAAHANKMRGMIELAVKGEGLEKAIHDDDFSKAIRNEMFSPGTSQDPRIQRIAKTMKGVYRYQRENLMRLGNDIGEIDNYMGWQAYDKAKLMAAGKKQFIQDALNTLDHEKTFKSEFSLEQKMARLDEAFDHIVMGEREGKGIDVTASRSLHYKDGDSTHTIMTKYGQYPSVIESMFAQIDHTSRRMALMEKFGPNYQDGYNNYKKWLEKISPATKSTEVELIDGKHPTGLAGIEARAKALGTDIANLPEALAKATMNIDNLYVDILGKTTAPSGTLLAQAGGSYRTLISTRLLGGATLSAFFPDFAANAALIRTFDGKKNIASNVAELFGEYSKTIFDRQKRAETMSLMGIYADDMVGGLSNIHGELNDGSRPGLLTEAARAMFKWTGLTDHTQNIRAATAKVLGARLATQSQRTFNELPEQLRLNLKRYSIGEKEWDIVRQAQVVFPDGVVALAPEKILELPAKNFDKKLPKEEVFLKFSTAMNETTSLGTLTGDAYTRTLFYQGQSDDKFWGQIGRFVAQFKQAPIQSMRLLNRVANSSAPDIVQRYGAAGKYFGDMGSVASAFAMMTSMGLLSFYAKEAAAFRTPPNPLDKDTIKEALVRGGGAGLMGDYLFAEYNKSYRNPIVDMAGPAAGDLEKVLKLYSAAIRGEFSENKMEALKFGIRQIPYNNIWWAKGALEHVLLDSYQEYLSPGYTLKMDRRLEKRGQKRILPTSDLFGRTPEHNTVVGGE